MSPALPPGWTWIENYFRDAPPFRAEHESAPLAIRQSRKPRSYGQWVALVRGSRLREKDGVRVIKRGTHDKGNRTADIGDVLTFQTAWAAANAALGFWPGARVRAPREG